MFNDLAVVLADGGHRIGDVATLRDQADLFGPVASMPTAWRCLHEITPAALDRVRTARARARRRAWELVVARQVGCRRLTEVFAVREVRTGFVGTGLPAAHQRVSGVPARHPVDPRAPLYMGYASGYRHNQASEADVTVAAGPLAGGTTMHVSRVRLRLDSWYDLLDADQRAARMFAPRSATPTSRVSLTPHPPTPTPSTRPPPATASWGTCRRRPAPAGTAGHASCAVTSTPTTAAPQACTSWRCNAPSPTSRPPGRR